MMAKARESKETQKKMEGTYNETAMTNEQDTYFKDMAALAEQKFKNKVETDTKMHLQEQHIIVGQHTRFRTEVQEIVLGIKIV